jgi:hypothetical protein
MSARTAKAVLTTLAALFLIAAEAPETRTEQYQRLRREAAAAVQGGDLVRAEAALEQALTLYPDVPGSYIRLARVQAAAGKREAALANVETYARMGQLYDASGDPALKDLTALPGWAEVAALFDRNRTAFGELTPVGSIAGDPEFIGEGLAHDGEGWLLSTVSGRTIVRLDAQEATPFLEADAATGAIFGMAADSKRGVLWAAEAWGADVPGGSGASKTGLLKVSLATGRILARFHLPGDGGKHQFGDVALAADGAVYATDSLGGGLWRLKAGGVALEQIVPPGAFISPQGMAICPGEKAMLVADYSTGLHRVDLETGQTAPLSGLRTGLAGTDGLVVAPDVDYGLRNASPLPMAVIATQNGVLPQRVMLLRISADCDEVEGAELVAANVPGLDDVTLAAVDGSEVVFVGHARWADRGPDGTLARPAPPPIRVFRATLPRTSY